MTRGRRWIGRAAVTSLLMSWPGHAAAQAPVQVVAAPAPADGHLNDGRMHASVALGTAFVPVSPAVEGEPHATDGAQVRADWSYQRLRRAGAVVLSAGSLMQPAAKGSPITEATVQLSLAHAAGRRTRLTFGQGWSFAPFRILPEPSTILADLGSAPADAGTATGPVYFADGRAGTGITRTMKTAVGVSRILDRRSSLDLSYSRADQGAGAGRSVATDVAAAGLGRRMSRSAVLRLGYGATRAGYAVTAGTTPVLQHTIDAGVDLSRPLPFSPGTTFEFRSGARILTGGTVSYRFEPMFRVDHALSSSWVTAVKYERPVQFAAGFAQPLYSDSVTAALGGRIGSRVRLESTLAYMSGTVGLEGGAAAFHARSAAVRTIIPLPVHWAMTVEYVDARHVFSGATAGPADLATALSRHALRFAFVWNAMSSAFLH